MQLFKVLLSEKLPWPLQTKKNFLQLVLHLQAAIVNTVLLCTNQCSIHSWHLRRQFCSAQVSATCTAAVVNTVLLCSTLTRARFHCVPDLMLGTESRSRTENYGKSSERQATTSRLSTRSVRLPFEETLIVNGESRSTVTKPLKLYTRISATRLALRITREQIYYRWNNFVMDVESAHEKVARQWQKTKYRQNFKLERRKQVAEHQDAESGTRGGDMSCDTNFGHNMSNIPGSAVAKQIDQAQKTFHSRIAVEGTILSNDRRLHEECDCQIADIYSAISLVAKELSARSDKACTKEELLKMRPWIHASIKCAGIRSLPVMAEHKQGPEHSSLRKPVERPNKPVIEIRCANRQCKHNKYIFGNVTQ